MRAIRNLLCLSVLAAAILFAGGCVLDDVVVDIIVPGYGGDIYSDYNGGCYCDDFSDDFSFDFYSDF